MPLHTLEPNRTGWIDIDNAPKHGPLAHLWWDRVAKCWRLALKPQGKVLVADFIAKYPNPAAILKSMSYPSSARMLFKKWMCKNDELAEQAGSAAMHGVVRAAMKFRPNQGCQFSTFAPFYIFSEVQNLDRDEWKHKESEHMRPDQDDIGGSGEPYGSGWNLIESPEPTHLMERTVEAKKMVRDCFAVLDKRDRRILADLYLGEGKATLDAVGRRHRITKERIRQLKNRAFATVRKKVSAEGMAA